MSGRVDHLAPLMQPGLRFSWGMVLIGLTVFQRSVLMMGILLVIYLALAQVSGKKVNLIYFLLMTVTIAFFHSLVPYGSVIFKIGEFPVTLGALSEGLLRGITIVGLVLISLFSVSPELRLPGRLGGLVARVFFYFEKLWAVKKRVSPKDFFDSTDKILIHLFPPEGSTENSPMSIPQNRQPRLTGIGFGIIAISLAVPILGLIFF